MNGSFVQHLIKMANPWHFRQTYKTNCSIQVLNNFCFGKSHSLPSYEIHCMLSRTVHSNIYRLYACAQLFITICYLSLQKVCSAYLRHLNFFYHTLPVCENWLGRENCNSHFQYCCFQGNLHH